MGRVLPTLPRSRAANKRRKALALRRAERILLLSVLGFVVFAILLVALASRWVDPEAEREHHHGLPTTHP